MKLTTIELFAGIAGFSSPHTRPLAFVEKEPTCRAILRRHYPHALILEDVKDVGAHNLPRVNVVKGGFPCQDLSVAGNRAGLSGARSGLFYELTRIADELRPDYLVWENVPGLLSSGAGRDFLSVLTELDRIGLAGGWTTVDAQFFGVAQRRCRVFGVFAHRDIGAARCAEILSLAARLPWNLTPGCKTRANVAATIRAGSSGDGVNRPGRRGDDDQNIVFSPSSHGTYKAALGTQRAQGGDIGGGSEMLVAHTLTANYGKQVDSSDTNHGPPNLIYQEAQYGVAEYDSAGALRAGRIPEHQMVIAPAIALSNRGRDTGETFETLRSDSHGALPMVAFGGERSGNASLTAHHGRNSGEDEFIPVIAFTTRGREDGAQVETQTDIAYALRTPGGGAQRSQVAGGFGVRRLTPRECERLQGFPDDYTAWGIGEQGGRVEMSDSVRYRMLGNAVCRRVSAWIDSQIATFSQEPTP
jgi:DNA (cytosine-5)-methyltransferase 1